jgi:AraC-like DNA-binding protein
MTEIRIPGYRHSHLRRVREYAERHFTDPKVSIEDAAVYLDLDPRTLRRSLSELGTSWRAILRELRAQRAVELLASTRFKIDHVARLSGHNSAPAFAAMFRQVSHLSPSEYRRAKKGPARAGGATGAFASKTSPRRPGLSGGWDAIDQQMNDEALARIEDRNLLDHFDPLRSTTIEEIAQEAMRPRRLREEPDHWHERHRRLAEWVQENEPRIDHRPPEGAPQLADDPWSLRRE